MSKLFPPPKFQFVDSAGRPYAGGSLTFYLTGTSTPEDTFSNEALSIANANPVELNSAGWPANNIFLSPSKKYKVVLKDSAGNEIFSADPVSTTDLASVSITKVGSGNPNGSVAGTAGSSGVLPTQYWDYTNNRLWVCSTTGTTSTAVWTQINLSSEQNVWTIADRISSAPAPAAEGTSYIVASSFGSFVTGQIVTDNGFGGLVVTQPPTDSGWIAYVQDEDEYYHFIGSAWVGEPATATDGANRPGTVWMASQADMESVDPAVPSAVSPSKQHFHPAHPKAGGNFNGEGATPGFRSGDRGMGAITDNGSGNYTLALDTAFADTNYWMTSFSRCAASATQPNLLWAGGSDTKTTSTMQVRTSEVDGTAGAEDTAEGGVTFWGDYA